jgi:carbamoyltransferase
MPDLIRTELAKADGEDDERQAKKNGKKFAWKLLFGDHHESHAASAFYPSPFAEAAILTIDGVGEWATSSIGTGKGNELTLLQELRYPNSVGLLYSAFTYYTGFKVNSGEYKVMGLAPYGEPKYVAAIKDNLLEVRDDGSIKLNQKYFSYSQGLRMTNGAFDKLFGGPPRQPESQLTQREMDLARSIQVITEEVMLKMARHVHRETQMKQLCLAGGVTLNCVANGRVVREVPFEKIWIQPAAGDAGGALGVALAIWHRYLAKPRVVSGGDAMKGSYLGPRDSETEIEKFLTENALEYTKYSRAELPEVVAGLLAAGKVVGLHQGRMEFGPRALGCRSIIGDARSAQMQSVMNLKIKYRESFRPFAPSVLRERMSEWFELDADSPYMLLVAEVAPEKRVELSSDEEKLTGLDKLKVKRSQIPAVTHVDYTARIQTVSRDTNPLYWEIIESFRMRTGCPVIVNTSFNVRGEPIVCTPADSYRCFMRTEMDYLVLENFVLSKHNQSV